MNFTAVHAQFNRRLFITKHLLKTKPAAALPPGFYLFSAEPQILNLARAALQQNFAEILLVAVRNSDLLSKAAACSYKTRAIKFTPPFAFVRPRSKRAAFYRRRDDVF